MANYVVSDTNLTAVANAIRQKGGTSASLEFPDDFVSAIGDIETGGGGGGGQWTTNGIADGTEPNGAITITGTSINDYAFTRKTGITSVSAPNVTTIGQAAFRGCENLTHIELPNLTSDIPNYCFDVLVTTTSSLEFADIGFAKNIGQYAFRYAPLSVLILRYTGGVVPRNTSAFTGSSMANTTVYVPSNLKSLYESSWHSLGCTFAAIEGSIYE